MSFLLKNSKIYDGTGSETFFGNILLENDKITQVGAALEVPEAQVIDLGGPRQHNASGL